MAKDKEAPAEGKAGGKKKLIIIALGGLLLLGGGAGGTYILVKPASAAEEKPAEEVLKPGAVTALDPITINLSDGNYLKLGIALQGVEAEGGGEGKAEAPDGSKALDLSISEFSGLSMAELGNAETRQHYKDELQQKIIEAYTTPADPEVKDSKDTKTIMGIYFTQFVMQ
ncbi:flagellar basal body-associated protein FliL [Kineococcus gynurae]|uniref:Flagellar protein FliL n=1 Tax=Kineococcus gynurae TaxID=452979 RepID=A0ABV5LR86_9ACTN